MLRDAKETELASKLQYLSKIDSQNPEKDLYRLLQFEVNLFQKNEQLKFWLRMSFFPPAHLAKVIEKEVIRNSEDSFGTTKITFLLELDSSLTRKVILSLNKNPLSILNKGFRFSLLGIISYTD